MSTDAKQLRGRVEARILTLQHYVEEAREVHDELASGHQHGTRELAYEEGAVDGLQGVIDEMVNLGLLNWQKRYAKGVETTSQ